MFGFIPQYSGSVTRYTSKKRQGSQIYIPPLGIKTFQQTNRKNIPNKNFWEEPIAYFSLSDTGRKEKDTSYSLAR
jgi:hypothetical protein